MNDFDRELERELHRVLDPIVTGAVPPIRVRAKAGFATRILGGAGAALAAKAVTGIAIAALAAGAAGAATEAVITRSLNPVDWGQQVKQQLHLSTAAPTSSSQHPAQSSPSSGGLPGKPSASALPSLPAVTPLPSVTPLPKITPLPTPTALPSVKPTCVPLPVIGGC